MSDYHEGRMSCDAQSDAESARLSELEKSGEEYCLNCLRYMGCGCDNPKPYIFDKPVEEYDKGED